MIWKYKNSFPRRYQLNLHDNYFIYTDLDNETNHGKIAWDSIEEVKETDNLEPQAQALLGYYFDGESECLEDSILMSGELKINETGI